MPILVGPAATIARGREGEGHQPRRRARSWTSPHSHAAAAKAVELVRAGQGRAADEGQPAHRRAARRGRRASETGLRTGRRLSHVFIMDVPTYHKVLIVTDAAINIAPTLEDKVDICQNAIDLARTLGVETAEGRDPRRGRDGELEDAGDDRRRRALQDGRARADHGRPARRPAGLRQRDQQGRGEDQGHHVRGRRRSRHPARARTSRPATCWPSS